MVRVIIERHIAESLEVPYEQAARKVLQGAFQAPGFISGESYKDVTNPNHRFNVSNWRSIHDWQHWQLSAERKELINELAPILKTDEKNNLTPARLTGFCARPWPFCLAWRFSLAKAVLFG